MAEITDSGNRPSRPQADPSATGRLPTGLTATGRIPIRTPPRQTRGGLSLGTQIFAATAALVIFAIALAVLVTYFVGSQVGDRAARQALDRSGKVQLDFQENTFDLLGLMASLIAEDPDFSAYVQEAIELGDVPSLLDQLDDRRQGLDFDFAMLLDADGMLVVRTDDPAARRQDFSQEPLFLRVQEEYEAWGIWARDQSLYYAMAVPVTAGDALVAYLVTAYAIDDAAAIRLRDINNTEVAFLLDSGDQPALAAKTLGPGAAGELLTYLAARPELEDGYFEVELQRQRWLAWIRPLQDLGGDTIGALIHLTSLEIELEGFRRIGRTLLGVGLLTMLLALAVSYLLPRRILRPVRKLADAAINAAEGDFDQAIKIDRSDEVGQLAEAFDVLLSELREKRDMEIYVNELARTLPEPEGSGGGEAAQPEERLTTLLGVELRNYSPSGFSPMPARETLDHLTFDLRRLSRSIRSRDGKAEAILGHRLIASFDGPRRSNRALAAAAEILSATGPRSLEIAAVLVSGSTVSGTTNWDQRPHYTLTGRTIDGLENLLRVARPGSLLISSEAREELRSTFDESGIGLQEHRSTVSELPLYSLSAEAVSRLAGPRAGSATAGGATAAGAADVAPGISDDFSLTHPMPSAGGFPPEPAQPTGFSPGPMSLTLSSVGPGSVLADRFEILSELGAGGMGVVYKARDRTLGELVALKMLKQEMWDDSERLERLKDELKLARKISHPNVLRTFDFGDADGYPFISMEYVRGVTLRQVLDSSGRLPLSAGLHTARQLCRGLAAAHAQGVLHRDIKPENLIIEASGKVKLMDFGIARPLQRVSGGQTHAGMIIGTPHYLAPEQLEGREADERADLYACGIVLYEIFTGRLPFTATGNLMELITRKLQEPPTPPRQHWASMPETLEEIILRCLQSDPAERFPDVAALLLELEVLRG